MDSKDRYIKELQDKRTKEEVEETREMYKVESQLRSQLLENTHQIRNLESDLTRKAEEYQEQN